MGWLLCDKSLFRAGVLVTPRACNLQVHPIPNDHCLAEGKPRFGTVPIHEFVDGVAIAPLRIRARQTVENRELRDFKIRQPQDRLGDSSS